MSDNSKLSFRPVCFSTNYSNFSSVSILKQYFMSCQCSDIKYIKDYHINYKHKITYEKSGQVEIAYTFYEISNYSKDNPACERADCFIIFYDLENNDSIRELNIILKYISFKYKEKKVYLIAIYTNIENANNFSEDNIRAYFTKNNLKNNNILKLNMDSSDELVHTMDSITEETLKEKFSSNNLLDFDNSKSKCIII